MKRKVKSKKKNTKRKITKPTTSNIKLDFSKKKKVDYSDKRDETFNTNPDFQIVCWMRKTASGNIILSEPESYEVLGHTSFNMFRRFAGGQIKACPFSLRVNKEG